MIESQALLKSAGKNELDDTIFQRLQENVLREIARKPAPNASSWRGSRLEWRWQFATVAVFCLIAGAVFVWNSHRAGKKDLAGDVQGQMPGVVARLDENGQSTAGVNDPGYNNSPQVSSPHQRMMAKRRLESNTVSLFPLALTEQRSVLSQAESGEMRSEIATVLPLAQTAELTGASTTATKTPVQTTPISMSAESQEPVDIEKIKVLWLEMAAKLERHPAEEAASLKEDFNEDQLVAKLVTDDPNVVIYWFADSKKGDKHEAH
jgi:hypothetical protein